MSLPREVTIKVKFHFIRGYSQKPLDNATEVVDKAIRKALEKLTHAIVIDDIEMKRTLN